MTSQDIRKDFLSFFESKGHTIVKSASLVPDNDPTLLFTNAGMNQFKDIFLGKGSRNYKRAADTQKCMRVSGKHNDLEEVGKDTYHHTLFEMLGNWSFGDYYKKEAIEWAWELLTDKWKLPKDKLYATVYHSDDEAFKLWGEVTDLDKNHILKFGEKENFWEMGETGPCGPCSEIHIDLGEGSCNKQGVKGHKCGVNTGCSRFIELWNLVFIQYNRAAGGELEKLPACHVDTGMGFERIVSVILGKKSNYDTDLFVPIIKLTEEMTSKKYDNMTGTPFRVIADHIRALTFSISDGVMPSNEGRGYVVRKILRRAIRYGKFLGFNSPFLHKMVEIVVNVMGDAFPEIRERIKMVESVILSEEESFYRTLDRGLDRLNEIVASAKKKGSDSISGDDLFVLYDSLGLPVDFAQNVAEDEGLTIDTKRFSELMEEQKVRARANWKGESFDYSMIKGKADASVYTGEDSYETDAVVKAIVRGNEVCESASENEDVVIITDRTPFYGERGGQTGDKGVIEAGQTRIAVSNTRIYEDVVLHFGSIINGGIKINDKVLLKVDRMRKDAVARNHTATHLIHKALRNVIGEHAAQSGSLVNDEILRFDFTHSNALSAEEIRLIEDEVNGIVLENRPVKITRMSKDEAVKSGAVAIFEEKYGDVVRVVEVDGYSRELCGGTHVKRSGDIGLVKIISESSISAGTRRLEAVTGLNSLGNFRSYYDKIKMLSALFNIDDEKVPERVRNLTEALKDRDREIIELKKQIAISGLSVLIDKADRSGGNIILVEKTSLEPDSMIAAVDEFKKRVENGVIFMISNMPTGKVSIIAGVTKSISGKIKAGDLARETAKIVGGGGGGKPELAQAGGKDETKIGEAISKAREMIKAALN